MGSKTIVGANPLSDLLMNIINMGVDISHVRNTQQVDSAIQHTLMNNGMNMDDWVHIKYKIKFFNDVKYVVVCDNMVSALLFSGILVHDMGEYVDDTEIIIEGRHYKFNKKTKKLTWKEVKK